MDTTGEFSLTLMLMLRFCTNHLELISDRDRLGVGSAIPKDIADGSFTRRAPTSNDKLLEQLIGKKRAKAHLAAKQEAERASARQQPTWQQKKEEKKVDEEEGRAATITSKRQRKDGVKGASKEKRAEEKVAAEVVVDKASKAEEGEAVASKDISDDDIDLKPKKRVKKSRAKPTSFLDELLAERSKKKKGKSKGDDDA
jgi:hypothetical protein